MLRLKEYISIFKKNKQKNPKIYNNLSHNFIFMDQQNEHYSSGYTVPSTPQREGLVPQLTAVQSPGYSLLIFQRIHWQQDEAFFLCWKNMRAEERPVPLLSGIH